MKFKTFASGSKGNCSIVICDEIKLLIDAGISFLSLKDHLHQLNLTPNDLTGILITHSHQDHIKGLKTIIKNSNLKVLIPEKMYDELKMIVPTNRVIYLKDINNLLNVKIELLHTSHDVPCSVGYVITYNNNSLVYITDTGYLNRKILTKITNKTIYLLESNHDEEMLMNGPYPPYLKEITGNNTKSILLAHLSEKNNTEELALNETVTALEPTNINIKIARQDEESELIEV